MPYDDTRAESSIAVIVKGYPRLSETFVAQELKALVDRGLRLRIYSLRHPYDSTSHPIHGEIDTPVTYLPEYLHEEPIRVVHAWRSACQTPGYRRARRLFLRDLRRDKTRNRVRRFGQACVLATELAPDVSALYAHFLHTPASVARYTAHMLGLPMAISAHAKDVWTTPAWDIRDKAENAAWITTCSQAGVDHLADIAPTKAEIRLARHGIDLKRFPANGQRTSDRDGTATPVVIVSVGRLVEKKGYVDLLAALSQLPSGLNWRLVQIGGGELRRQLEIQAHTLGLASRIQWLGPQPQTVVLEWLRRADLFVLASQIAASGDRDGLPNVLLEAQSQGVPCIATDVTGIPELIESGTTGLLVPPQQPGELSAAIERLIKDPATRVQLGQAGEARVRADFSMSEGADRLAAWLSNLVSEPATA